MPMSKNKEFIPCPIFSLSHCSFPLPDKTHLGLPNSEDFLHKALQPTAMNSNQKKKPLFSCNSEYRELWENNFTAQTTIKFYLQYPKFGFSNLSIVYQNICVPIATISLYVTSNVKLMANNLRIHMPFLFRNKINKLTHHNISQLKKT